MSALDPRTGRPPGDHGTANDAIDFALDVCATDACAVSFLERWRIGDTNWLVDPDFYQWLRDHRPHVATTEPSRLRMWAHQITFTLILVGLIEVGLWFFR